MAGSLVLGNALMTACKNVTPESESLANDFINVVSSGTGQKILVLMSAGAKEGNTDRLTNAWIDGAVAAGHSVVKANIGNVRLDGCRGCGVCQRNGNRCVVNDSMQQLYPIFAECDTIVMASPIYFWTITAKLKSFIERLYAISVNDKYPAKNTILLMTAGDDGEHTFDHVQNYWKIVSGGLGNKSIATYFAGGCKGCEADNRYIDPKHFENAYNLGRNL